MIKDIKILNCWEDLTISQYIELQSLDDKDEDYEINIVELLTTLTYEEIINMDLETLNGIKKELLFLFNPPINKKIDTLTLDGKDYYVQYKPNKLLTTQYINIQPLFSDSINNLHKLIANVLIPIDSKYDDESYDKEELEHTIYNQMELPTALGLLECISSTCVDLTSKYTAIFGSKEDNEEEQDEEDKVETFETIWSWMILCEQVVILSNLNINEVWYMKIEDFLLYATYIKAKRENEAEQIKKYKQQ